MGAILDAREKTLDMKFLGIYDPHKSIRLVWFFFFFKLFFILKNKENTFSYLFFVMKNTKFR